MSTRRRTRSGSMAGWLFADLTLLLCFVFFDSSVSGMSTKTTISSTTTISKSTTSDQGARPDPIVIRVRATLLTSSDELVSRLTKSLGAQPLDQKFLVVIALGGHKPGEQKAGDKLARQVSKKLENSWGQILKGVTYFETGHDSSPGSTGYVLFKLFPIQEKLSR